MVAQYALNVLEPVPVVALDATQPGTVVSLDTLQSFLKARHGRL